ncbi:hypothetical protein [Phenylobacterium soli]|uniref:Uncharacterized protein n=1 Tax=Phenylobacterium soli TaxID=2170551 RepID=A0A328AJW1_9CAUL|nr:hypothetical protein [Phenylobacterium soli]RAK54787.1 hypothetical protein DJ017_09740 [Phenylobacterium soli]
MDRRLQLRSSPSRVRRFLRALGSILATWSAIGAGAISLVLLNPQPLEPPPPVPRVRAVEPPPQEFAAGPTLTGHTYELDLDDVFKVSYLCTLALGPTWPPGGYWMGCYDARMDAVIVPAKGAWPSETERRALVAHEWAHARGWRHVNDGKFGRPPPGTQYAQEPRVPVLPSPTATVTAAR